MTDHSHSSTVDDFANFEPVSSAPVIDRDVSTSSNIGVNEYSGTVSTNYNVRTHENFTSDELDYHTVNDFTGHGNEMHTDEISGKEYTQRAMIKAQSSAAYCSRTSIIRSTINSTNYEEYIGVDMLSEEHQPNDDVIQESQEIASEQMLPNLASGNENLTFRSQGNHLSYSASDDTLGTFNSENHMANTDEILLLDEHERSDNEAPNNENRPFNAESVHYVCSSSGEGEEQQYFPNHCKS